MYTSEYLLMLCKQKLQTGLIKKVIFFVCVSSRNSLQSEEIVSELMYSFLIPELEKIRQKGL